MVQGSQMLWEVPLATPCSPGGWVLHVPNYLARSHLGIVTLPV